MKTMRDWIRHHQVVTFFLLAYAITWPGLFLVYFIYPGNMAVEGLASPIVFGPVIAAMVVSGIVKPHPKLARSRASWIVFLLTWLVASVVGMLYFWQVVKIELQTQVVLFNCLLALLPAWMVSNAYARNPGIREHFSTLLKPRGPALWYLVIFLIFPGVQLLDIGITRLFGGEADFILDAVGLGSAAIFLTLEFLRGFFETGGINEESGWRGFALPRLQAKYPVIVSVVIVWFFWAAWHLPYDFGRGLPLDQILENRILWNLVLTILLSWVYNRTKGSILAPALFHPAMNTFGNNLGGGTLASYLFIGLAVLAIITDKMWKKLPSDHPAVYASPERSIVDVPDTEARRALPMEA